MAQDIMEGSAFERQIDTSRAGRSNCSRVQDVHHSPGEGLCACVVERWFSHGDLLANQSHQNDPSSWILYRAG